MKKQLCILALLLLTTLIACQQQEVADVMPPVEEVLVEEPVTVPSEVEIATPIASNAMDSYEEFMVNVPSDENFQPLYPDTFCGAYCEENQIILHMVLTDDDAETLAYYQSFFSNPDIVIYDTATYSYNALRAMMDEIVANSSNWHSVGVDESENYVDVSASDVDAMHADLEAIFADTWDMDDLPVRVELGSLITTS